MKPKAPGSISLSRRTLLRGFACGSIVLAGGFVASKRVQAADELPHLTDDDPQASALKYKQDATKSERKDDKQFCHTCRYFKGKTGDAWAKCDLYPGKLVNADGWCSLWAKKG